MLTPKLFLLCLLCSLLFFTCQKDHVTLQQLPKSKSKPHTIQVGQAESFAKSGGGDDIVLGQALPNPYAHDTVLAAWNAIYPNAPRTSLPITHVYKKYLPQDWKALNALQEAIDALDSEGNEAAAHDPYLFNYPLHYEVTQQGVYYHDPSIATDKPSYHYAVVEPSFVTPTGSTGEVLAELEC